MGNEAALAKGSFICLLFLLFSYGGVARRLACHAATASFQQHILIHGRGLLLELSVPGKIQGYLHRSEEHTSELQSLMRNSYAVFCLKKKNHRTQCHTHTKNKQRLLTAAYYLTL